MTNLQDILLEKFKEKEEQKSTRTKGEEKGRPKEKENKTPCEMSN